MPPVRAETKMPGEVVRKERLLNEVASAAYSAGYSGKLHFATIDMAERLPSAINLLGIAAGILALFLPCFGAKGLSATLIVLSVSSMYYMHYQERRADYERVGKILLIAFDELRSLANDIAALSVDADLTLYQKRLGEIIATTHGQSISKQAFLATWYAHFKFFWASETGWINDYRDRKFGLFRDKLPISMTIAVVVALIAGALYLASGHAVTWGCA